jgi:hypothetical protein
MEVTVKTTIYFLIALFVTAPAFAARAPLVHDRIVIMVSENEISTALPDQFYCSGESYHPNYISLEAAKYIDANLAAGASYLCTGSYVVPTNTYAFEIVQISSCQIAKNVPYNCHPNPAN